MSNSEINPEFEVENNVLIIRWRSAGSFVIRHSLAAPKSDAGGSFVI
jgi:hypothetical protein